MHLCGVLFDLDGTLVDTATAERESWPSLAAVIAGVAIGSGIGTWLISTRAPKAAGMLAFALSLAAVTAGWTYSSAGTRIPMMVARYVAEYAVPILTDAAEKAGRSVEEIELAAVVTTAVHEDGAQARDWARRHLAFYAVIPYFDVMFQLHGFEQEAAAVRAAAGRDDLNGMLAAVTDEMVDTFAIAGTPDQCRAKLASFDNVRLVVLFSPSFQLGPDEIAANYEAILSCFAS